MTPAGRQRLAFAGVMVATVAAAVVLALVALQDSVSFFFSPSDVARLQAEQAPQVAGGRLFRLGGMVKAGSVIRDTDTATVRFVVTDFQREMAITYRGILPALFREGQGMVANGRLQPDGVFHAQEILAKHDENYMPPEVKRALKRAAESPAQGATPEVPHGY